MYGTEFENVQSFPPDYACHCYSFDRTPIESQYSMYPSYPHEPPYDEPSYEEKCESIFEPPHEPNCKRTVDVNRHNNNVNRQSNDVNRHSNDVNVNNNDINDVNNMIGGGRGNRWKYCICGWICFCIMVLAIVLPVLFLVKRDVTFEIEPINISEETINIDPSGFSIPVNPTIHTENDNFFDISLDMVLVTGSHPSYAGGTVPLGTGNLSSVVLSKRSEMDVTFPFLVQYNNTFDENTQYFSELLTNCTNSEEAGRNLYLDVRILVNYHMWAKDGNLDEHREFIFPCPISAEKASTIQGLIGSGIV
jgi:hypothetical protein